MKVRYLTKSRFKLAMECPTKLFYTGNAEYADHKLEDQFLQALAEGGFQVGELAKCYFPGGYDIKSLDYDEALCQTNELLKNDQVIIYEAAFCYKSFFIRADILIKDKNNIELIEVKAKSFDSAAYDFCTKGGKIKSDWKPYLEDVAFQKYVVSQAMQGYSVSAYLMLADKNSLCPADGLNQKFKITSDKNGRKGIVISKGLTAEDLSDKILTKIYTDNFCDIVYTDPYNIGDMTYSFKEMINFLSDNYTKDMKISSRPSSNCASCEFCTNNQEKIQGLKSGFEECWKEVLGWTDRDFEESTVLDIWNFRKKNDLMEIGRIKIKQITEQDISPHSDDKPGISASERQWLQISKVQSFDQSVWIDRKNLWDEMNKWVYPLHFIDFETTMAAIPFNKGRHPYEGIAFQFSHHVVYKNGLIKHSGQYLNTTPGVFPNYDFVRNLKKELEQDEGSIFRYAAHENTYLNTIFRQLMEDQEYIPDRDELCSFIQTITQSVGGSSQQWIGSRNMIDMCELVKRFYYDPAMKGSNSIKKVLPAILNSSDFLQRKYVRPIYGTDTGIQSLNYKDWKWIEYENGMVKDPYSLLPKMFMDISDEDFELLSESDELKDGGAALTAYARLQFEEMSDYERTEICRALLKYCELDTLAMVMIYEGWRNMLI